MIVAHASDAVTFTDPRARDSGVDYDSDSDEDFWAQEGADSCNDDDVEEEDEGSDESNIVPDGVFSEDEVSDAGDIAAVRRAENPQVGEKIALGPTETAARPTTSRFPELAGSPLCAIVPEMGPSFSLRFTSAPGTAAEVSDMEFWNESPFEEKKKKEGAAAAREAACTAFWLQHEPALATLVHGSKDGMEKLREAFEKQFPDAKDKRVTNRIKALATKINGRWTVSGENLQKFGLEDKQTAEGTRPLGAFFPPEKREPEKESPGDEEHGKAQARNVAPDQHAEPAALPPATASESTSEEQSCVKQKRRRIIPQLVDGTSGKTEHASSTQGQDTLAGKAYDHNENSVSAAGESPAKAPRRNATPVSRAKTPSDSKKNKSIMGYKGVVVVSKQPDTAPAPATKAVHPFLEGEGPPQS